MWTGTAWDWAILAVLYAVGLTLFGALGGIAGASRAIQRWGRATSVRRAKRLRWPLPPPESR